MSVVLHIYNKIHEWHETPKLKTTLRHCFSYGTGFPIEKRDKTQTSSISWGHNRPATFDLREFLYYVNSGFDIYFTSLPATYLHMYYGYVQICEAPCIIILALPTFLRYPWVISTSENIYSGLVSVHRKRLLQRIYASLAKTASSIVPRTQMES